MQASEWFSPARMQRASPPLFPLSPAGLAESEATSPKERGPVETQPGRKAETDRVFEGISEGFHLAESERVAPRGADAITLCQARISPQPIPATPMLIRSRLHPTHSPRPEAYCLSLVCLGEPFYPIALFDGIGHWTAACPSNGLPSNLLSNPRRQ